MIGTNFWVYLLPLFAGAAIVGQGGLNRHLARGLGLASALALNSLTLLAASGTLFVVSQLRPEWLPALFRAPAESGRWPATFLLPGLLGFTILTCVPVAISRLGALQTFVIVVASQLVLSGVWDAWIEDRPFSVDRAIGAGLALAGAAWVSWRA